MKTTQIPSNRRAVRRVEYYSSRELDGGEWNGDGLGQRRNRIKMKSNLHTQSGVCACMHVEK